MIKRFREMKKVKRSLIEQVELLNKASKELKYDEGISAYSKRIAEIYKILEIPFLIMGITFLLNLSACFIVFLYKFLRRKT